MEDNSTTLSVTPRSVGVRYGIIMAAISIVLFLVFVIIDIDLYIKLAQWMSGCLAIVIVILAHLYYRHNGDGFMNYGQGVGIAFWAGLVSSVIGSVFTYVYVKFIDSSMSTAIREKTIRDMQEKGQSDEQIEMAMKIVDFMINPETQFLIGLFVGILFMVIFGVIVAIFTQKPRPETFA